MTSTDTDAEEIARLVAERDRLREEAAWLERALAGERERNQALRFQRDRYRHQVAALRARRWWRLGAALRDAARSPRTLLTLPVTLARVLAGPPAAPAVPPPAEPGEGEGERAGAVIGQVRVPTETRPPITLAQRYLLPPRARAVKDLRIAAVLDTFTESCLAPDCDLLTFRPDTWQAALEAEKPHLLLVESAWKGTGGSWEYQVGSYAYPQSVGLPHLSELVGWCREHDVPTVFWNKEDPVHFAKFAEAARLFDVVLTSDADRVEAYEQLDGLRAEVVAPLPFAAQPALHHPTHELADRDLRPVFAGTYYRNRHPERREQLERLLDAARDFGLVIYDRTHGDPSPDVGFPERFADHVVGGVPYDEMVRIYRRHRLFLNTNSVVDSPTMFSRRVFELLACATPVVSTPGRGMTEMFGGIVRTVTTEQEAADAIGELLGDDAAWEATARAGLRAVLAEHTYQHRLARVAAFAGYQVMPWARRRATALLLDGGDGDAETRGLAARLAAAEQVPTAVGTPDPSRFADLPVAAFRQPGGDERARWRHLAEQVDTPFVLLAGPGATPAMLADLAGGLLLTRGGGAGFAQRAWTHVGDVDHTTIALRRGHVTEHGWETAPDAAQRQRTQLADAGLRPYSVGPARPDAG